MENGILFRYKFDKHGNLCAENFCSKCKNTNIITTSTKEAENKITTVWKCADCGEKTTLTLMC